MTTGQAPIDYFQLAQQIKQWATELGFHSSGITDAHLQAAEIHLMNWLRAGFHGEMAYMAKHGERRTRPADLIPGTLRIISVAMNYLPEALEHCKATLGRKDLAYIARYSLGKDYHRVLRRRLQQLAELISAQAGDFAHRAFTDSAPVMEKALAEKAGLGWIGKHTNLINKNQGSIFFIGEIYTNIPLAIDTPAENHCGSCETCIQVCPTQAIVGPYQLDARRCIAYLTIEYKGIIPEELRPLVGNRVFGCDDCQLFCPWNRYAQVTPHAAFSPRHHLDQSTLIELFQWTEQEFLTKTQGSALRRIGYPQWLRNIAVGLGNAPSHPQIIPVLQQKLNHSSALVQEHVAWALRRHGVGH